MFKRLSPRWIAEAAGVAALVGGFWLLSPIVGLVVLGVGLILEGSFGEPFRASQAEDRP